MALNADGVDKAEITYCYEVDTMRGADGAMAQFVRQLPWVYVTFGNLGEDRYVAPLGAIGVGVLGQPPYRQSIEYTTSREPTRQYAASGDMAKNGPMLVHSFG